MYQDYAGRPNTAPACRHVQKTRKTKRCGGGAFSLLLPLVFATAMLSHTPVVSAVDMINTRRAATTFCQLSTTHSEDNFKLPALGGSYSFLDTNFGSYIQGTAIGVARLVGVIHDISDDAGNNTFAVDIMLDDRLDPGDTGYPNACRNLGIKCGPADGWHVYTALTGTLTGLSGAFTGAVYNVTLSDTGTCNVVDTDTGTIGTTPAFQVGIGANTHNMEPGAFAEINFELDDPDAFPSLLEGPFAGEMSLEFVNIGAAALPTPTPSLTGTWGGSVECAGIADFIEVETITAPAQLRIGEYQGDTYCVELSDGAGVIDTYMVEYIQSFPASGNQGAGQMVRLNDPLPSQSTDDRMIPNTSAWLKARNNPGGPATLKARELRFLTDGLDIDDLPDGSSLCKWSFTQTDTATVVPSGCTVCGDGVVEGFEQCEADGTGDGGSFECIACRRFTEL